VCIDFVSMGWLRLKGSLKKEVSFAKKPYKRDYVLHNLKEPTNLSQPIIEDAPIECHNARFVAPSKCCKPSPLHSWVGVQIRGVCVCVLNFVGNTGCAYRLSTLEENIEKLHELGGVTRQAVARIVHD